jgi:hypothetical protein
MWHDGIGKGGPMSKTEGTPTRGDTIQFRFAEHGQAHEGTVTEVFTASPIEIDGRTEVIVPSDLPCVLVRVDETETWLVPIHTITKVQEGER